VAAFMLTSVTTVLNSVDYTDHLKNAVVTLDAAQLDTTDFASAGWTEAIGGLKSGTLTLNWMDDIADNDVDEELFALLGTVVTFTCRASSTAVGPTSPEYRGSVLITGHTFGGDVGALAMKSLTFPITGAVTRAVA
jgi:hypothetical protein